MKKALLITLSVLFVSTLNFAGLKLKLPAELTGETTSSVIHRNIESNLKLNIPSEISTQPGDEFMRMWFIGLMADATFPMGDFGDGWSTGFSGHAMVGYMLARSILLNFSVGYVSFTEKESVEGSDNSFSWVPLLLGVNYVFNPGQKFMPYVGFALGLYLASYSYSYTLFGQTYSGDESDSNIGIAPRVGAYYLASAALLIALSAEYNVIFTEGSSTTSLGVLLGFMYALK
jgi:outer membrane protein W